MDNAIDWNKLWKDEQAASYDTIPGVAFRASKIVSTIQKFYSPTDSFNVIDFGCGTGLFLKNIHTIFPNSNCLGIEQSEQAIIIAKDLFDDGIYLQIDLQRERERERERENLQISQSALKFLNT